MKRKGFTLIELLAVIVVLAIVIVIATPMILNVINKTKLGSAEQSANAYIKAVEKYEIESQLNNNSSVVLKPNVKYNLILPTVVGDSSVEAINKYVQLKGEKPTGREDYIKLDDKKAVKEGQMTFGLYVVEIKNYKVHRSYVGEKIKVESIALTTSESVIERGSKLKIEAIFNPIDATDQDLIYEIEDESIVTVDANGVIKGIKNGSTKINITSVDNKNAKAEITVTVISPSAVTGVTVKTKDDLESIVDKGEYLQLEAILEPSDATSNALTWTSENEEIATVDETGQVFGKKYGNVVIKATSQSGKEGTINITVANTCTYEIGQTWDFSEVKANEFEVPCHGTYKLEVWGAEGGYRSSSTYSGKGGYSYGNATLSKKLPLYVYVGGSGNSGTCTSNICKGGFNGGGYRYKYYGGGGASDIRINSDSLYARVIVAGGGGSDGATSKAGMYGGGKVGGSSTDSYTANSNYCGKGGNQTYSGYSESYTISTQVTTGLTTNTLSNYGGGFGFGGGGVYLSSGYGGAGGGGWYGGSGTVPDGSGDDDRGGGGGSGYVYTSTTVSDYPSGCLLDGSHYLADANTIAGNQAFKSPTGTDETGHKGNGYARITLVDLDK